MRRHKISLPASLIRIRSNTFKLLAITIAVLLAGISSWVGIHRFLRNTDYFVVKGIVFHDGLERADDLSYLKGRNIFAIDLDKESSYIAGYYPDYRKVRLVRVLPNRLFVDLAKRKAVGLVKLYRYFCVDEDGVIFNLPTQSADGDLPVISGLETKLFRPRVGSKYNIRELMFALKLIREMGSSRSLKDYLVKRINVANLGNVSFFIVPDKAVGVADELEIKVDADDIKDKINILATLVHQSRDTVANIKYIDLRFKEPVIKLKDAK